MKYLDMGADYLSDEPMHITTPYPIGNFSTSMATFADHII